MPAVAYGPATEGSTVAEPKSRKNVTQRTWLLHGSFGGYACHQ